MNKEVPLEPTKEMVNAPRQIILYAETPGRTLEGLRAHLVASGVDYLAWFPVWATRETGHLTKAAIAILVYKAMLSVAPTSGKNGGLVDMLVADAAWLDERGEAFGDVAKVMRKAGAALQGHSHGDSALKEPAASQSAPNSTRDASCAFGFALDEMDLEAFLNMRDWLEKTMTEKGAVVDGSGVGMGQADLDFILDGYRYNVSIRPLPMKP